MTNVSEIRAAFRSLRRRTRRVIRAARGTSARIAVAKRSNVVKVVHHDEPGATTAATARQEGAIRQTGGGALRGTDQ